jgi:hypothetical protein
MVTWSTSYGSILLRYVGYTANSTGRLYLSRRGQFPVLLRGVFIAAIAQLKAFPYEHSEKAQAPHTNEPRDVPRCGALCILSLLQKPLHYRGIDLNSCQLLCM